MEKFAHSLQDQPTENWEPLADHLAAVGKTAGEFARVFGADAAAQCMGRLHDIGKASTAYQNYIRKGRDEGDPRGPDHSTAGAKEAMEAYGDAIGRLMAYGVAGHHGGLMDFDALARRRGKTIEGPVRGKPLEPPCPAS